MNKKLHHYHLVTTKVAFLEPEQQAIGALELNVLMRTVDRNFTAADIGKSQQVAQLQFFEKMQNQNLEVKDVLITAISYLGHMSEDKFQAIPAGTAKQQRPATPTNTPFDA